MRSDVAAETGRLTLREKIGQMVTVGWDGSAITPSLERIITEYRVGGISLLPRNLVDADQTVALCRELQDMAAAAGHSLPLWLAADQEGGSILAVRDGVVPFPGNMGLGACRQSDLAHAVGKALAEEVTSLGINMNYAPVLDVNSNPLNPIIGVRSFGSDPALVSELGVAFMQGTMDGGVIPVCKHFPGHGDTALDSHLALPVVHRDRGAAEKLELVPFRRAVASGAPAIMTSHVVFPALDPGRPATLSRRILTGLLRENMGFDGLILTDCLEMEAIAARWPAERFAVMAVEAGVDILLVSHSFDRQVAAIHSLERAVLDGSIDESRIDESVRRITGAKRKWCRPFAGRLPDGWESSLAEHRELERRVAHAMVTVVRNEGLLPLSPGRGGIAAVWPNVVPRARTSDPAEVCPLGAAIRRYRPDVAEIQYPQCPTDDEISRIADELRRNAPRLEVLVIGTASSKAADSEAQARLVNRLLQLGIPAVVCALRNPYDILRIPGCRNYVACYSYQPAAVEALSDVIFGESPAIGVAPVDLTGGGK